MGRHSPNLLRQGSPLRRRQDWRQTALGTPRAACHQITARALEVAGHLDTQQFTTIQVAFLAEREEEKNKTSENPPAAKKAQRSEAAPAVQRAEACRREGNDLLRAARSISKEKGTESLRAASLAFQKYETAISKYSEGVALAPEDHRLLCNRAMCYAALKDWAKCREDALRVTKLKPQHVQGWALLAAALSCCRGRTSCERTLRTIFES